MVFNYEEKRSKAYCFFTENTALFLIDKVALKENISTERK